MNRRKFLRNSLASCVLGLGGISAYQLYLQSNDKSLIDDPFNYQFLSSDDRVVLQVLIPVFLADKGSAIKISNSQILQNIDGAITLLPQRTQAELRELFDLLGSMLGRVIIARVWLNWQAASPESLDQFIGDWRNSSLELLQIAYKGLHKLIIGSYYSESESWEQIGYPGPPKLSFTQ